MLTAANEQHRAMKESMKEVLRNEDRAFMVECASFLTAEPLSYRALTSMSSKETYSHCMQQQNLLGTRGRRRKLVSRCVYLPIDVEILILRWVLSALAC